MGTGMNFALQIGVVIIFMTLVVLFVGSGIYLLNVRLKLDFDAFIVGAASFVFLAIVGFVLALRHKGNLP